MVKKAMRFLTVSGMSFLLTTSLMFVQCEWLLLPGEPAYAITLILAFFFNFAMLRWFVFSRNKPPVKKQFFQFMASTISFRVCEYGAFLLLHTLFNFQYMVVVILNCMIFTCVKFVFYNRNVFGDNKSVNTE